MRKKWIDLIDEVCKLKFSYSNSNRLIANKLRIPQKQVKLIIENNHKRWFTISHPVHLGHKNSPYFTEEEMLKGIPKYNYHRLSKTEKEIWNNPQKIQ